MTVRSFDLATQQYLARIVLATGTNGNISSGNITATSPNRLVRWGTNGLAVFSSDGVYLYSGPFVH
jgi:hypothetical protein